MVSTFLRLNDYLLLEYYYEEIEHTTSDAPLIKISSLCDNSVTIANLSKNKTVTDTLTKTLVDIDKNHVAVDEEGIYLLDNSVDDRIYINKFNDPSINYLMYNRLRIHVLSGYNFDDIDGFAINAYILGYNKKLINLCNWFYLKNSTGELHFNTKPLKISESVFDKYIDVDILSVNHLLQLQDNSPEIIKKLFGENIYEDYEINLEVNLIQKTQSYGSYQFLSFTYSPEPITTVIQTKSIYDTVSSAISVNQKDCCLEYRAEYKGDSIEDFIYELNSRPGNDFYLNHTITIIEQVGQSFPIVDRYSTVQTDNYSKLYKYRPVLYNKMANTVSLEHEIQLINRVDGNGFSVRGSLTVPVSAIKSFALKLNVPEGEHKIYNKIATVKHNLVHDLSEITKTKIVPTYIKSNDISVDKKISILPFRNNIILKISSVEKEIIKPNLTYYLTFLKSDNSKIMIKETLAEDINRSDSLFFIIEEQTALSIINTCSPTCYVIAKSSESESVMTTLSWTKE